MLVNERGMGAVADARDPGYDALEGFANCLPDIVTRDNLLVTASLLRHAAAATLPGNPLVVSKISTAAGYLILMARGGREPSELELLGDLRALSVEVAQIMAVNELADLLLGKEPGLAAMVLSADFDIGDMLLQLDQPLASVEVTNALAEVHWSSGQRAAAYTARLEALNVLHWLRHGEHDLADRRRWWETAQHTLQQAMRQAVDGQDWAGLAELIEIARLQFAPQDGTAHTAPFIRVRGVSRLAAARWYRADERSTLLDLEDAASCVHGPGTWWWSTWAVDEQLYWALVPPSGEVYGGVRDVSRASPLGDALAELRHALPVPYPGEVLNSVPFVQRVEGGALCGPLDSEADLARRLAELVPDPLRDWLARAGESVGLAIAPAQLLANLPWALLGIGRDDVRLIERARIALAPPASMLARVADRPAATSAPLRLAVLNPGGTRSASGEELPAADELMTVIPPGTSLVRADDLLTVNEFGAVLRAVPPGSSAVFACHTDPGDGTPLSGGLKIQPADEPEVLSAGLLFTEPERYPIPEQALILACESADLRHTAAGEWLVLGPALLWAGARRLVVTSYPIPDDDVVDRALMDCLLTGDNLAEVLRATQLARLAAWRDSRGFEAPPVTWAGHVALGVFGQTTLRIVYAGADQSANRSV